MIIEMRIKTYILFVVFVMSNCFIVQGYDCKIDGIYYNLHEYNNTASVTNKGEGRVWDIYTNSYKGNVVVPDKIIYNGKTYKVVEVEEHAFSSSKKLKSVKLPNTIWEIGKSAFDSCYELESVELPDTLRMGIREKTFYYCGKLKNLKLPAWVFSIDDKAFGNCYSIESISFPLGLAEIGDGAFKNCSGLKEVSLPEWLFDVSLNAFEGCDKIEKVIINEDQTLLAEKIFHSTPTIIFHSMLQELNAKRVVSDVDTDIPNCSGKNDRTFALVIANEDYRREANVPNASNDGLIFAEYMRTTLGIPDSNVVVLENATINDMNFGLKKISQFCDAYKGDVSVIVFYAGHGISDELQKDSYLLPSDGYCTDLSTCYPLSKLYDEFGKFATRQTLVFLDAAFCGFQRNGDMLQSSRGVRLRPGKLTPQGNTVVFSASTGDENAISLDEQNHGLFTYYLLKKIRDSKGKVSLGDLYDSVKEKVSVAAISKKGTEQTPSTSVGLGVSNWRKLKLQ